MLTDLCTNISNLSKIGVIFNSFAQIAKGLKITPILDKLLEYKRNWIQHVNRMPRNRLPRVMKRYSPSGRRNHDRPLKRLLDVRDRNGSTSGATPGQIYDDISELRLYGATPLPPPPPKKKKNWTS